MGGSALVVACLILLAGQPDPGADPNELARRIKSGTKVFVIDSTGAERAGTITSVSAQGIELQHPVVGRILVPEASIARIERTDRLWNGFLIGAGIIPVMTAVSGNLGEWSSAHSAMTGLYATIGILADWLHQGRTVLHTAERRPGVSIAPLVAPRAAGVVVQLRFGRQSCTHSPFQSPF